MRLVFALLVCLMLVLPTAAHAQTPFGETASTWLTGLEHYGFAGTVLIAEGGSITLNEGYGPANREDGTPNAPATVYDIGSITKVFTQTAILKLEMAGLLHTEDPIGQYLENVPADKADITIQQIIEMRGGLPEYHDDWGDFQPMTREEALRRILNWPLIAEPGTEAIYSNSGYTLLAILIEEISGQSYQDYLRENIFNPLGMNNTGFVGEALPNLAYTDNTFDEYGTSAGWPYSWVLVGNGGMASTAEDLYRFAQAVMDGDFLAEAVKAKSIFARRQGLMAGGGSDTDFSAAMFYDADTGNAIVSLSNQILYSGEAVALTLLEMMNGATLPIPPDVIEMPSDITTFVGSYTLGDGTLEVSVGDAGLKIGVSGQAAIDAVLGGENEEFADLNERTLQIQADMREGDYVSMHEALGGGMSLAEVEAEEGGFWNRMVAENGAFQSIEVLGTAPGNSSRSITTTFRLNFENGAVYLHWGWEGESLADIRVSNSPLPAYALTFLPTGEQTFAAYSLSAPYLTELTFDAAGNLTITSADNAVPFQKVH